MSIFLGRTGLWWRVGSWNCLRNMWWVWPIARSMPGGMFLSSSTFFWKSWFYLYIFSLELSCSLFFVGALWSGLQRFKCSSKWLPRTVDWELLGWKGPRMWHQVAWLLQTPLTLWGLKMLRMRSGCVDVILSYLLCKCLLLYFFYCSLHDICSLRFHLKKTTCPSSHLQDPYEKTPYKTPQPPPFGPESDDEVWWLH